MKLFFLFLFTFSWQMASAITPDNAKTSYQIIEEREEAPDVPGSDVELEKMNTSPNPVQNAQESDSGALIKVQPQKEEVMPEKTKKLKRKPKHSKQSPSMKG